MDNSGWIKLHRRILKWEWWGDQNATRLFIYLLISANFENKKWRGRIIPRGSLVTGRGKLSKETGLSAQSTRTALERLKSTSEVTSESTNQFTIISICNYEKFQAEPTNESTSHLTNEQQTNNKRTTTTKEDKNERMKEKREAFVKPTVEELKAYCQERTNGVDPETFWNFYESKGWKIGSAPMKSWQAAMVTWGNRQKNDPKAKKTSGYPIFNNQSND